MYKHIKNKKGLIKLEKKQKKEGIIRKLNQHVSCEVP